MRRLEIGFWIFFMVIAVVLSKKLESFIGDQEVIQQEVKRENKEIVILLDAGHGGADPGKVGVHEELEKDINLSVAKKLQSELEKKNIHVVMTRESDEMLSGEMGEQGKVADMKERVRIINDTKPNLAISIHQNSYQDSQVHGAQVFYYSSSKEGEKVAFVLQEKLKEMDEQNTRQPKANNTYFILKRTEVPMVIVECGFLSNESEAKLLKTEEYQETLAQAIMEGILSYLQDTGLYEKF